jgi:hypothetical protein
LRRRQFLESWYKITYLMTGGIMQGALPPHRPNVVEMKGGSIPGWRNVKKK